MSQGDLSKIERGVVAPTTLTLLKLVHALGAELTLTVPAEAGGDPAAEIEVEAEVHTNTESLSLVMA